MRLSLFGVAMLAAAFPIQYAAAQGTVMVPTGGANPAPVPQSPPNDPDDTPESIARDAARDLRDTRFYNRPGATRADYDREWQECRLIARGSRTPSGMVPYYYNPAVISPLAAGIGAGIGGAIAGAIAEGQQRRANRRACLLIRGWRLVQVPDSETARVRDMTDEQRSAYFDTIVGAERVEGELTERTSFALEPDPVLDLDAPVEVPGTIFLGRRVDPATPFELAPGEAAVVLAFRRPEWSGARTGEVVLARYDVEKRDLVYQPRHARRDGDTTTYRMNVISRERRAPYEVHVLRVTPGDYVIDGHVPGVVPVTTSFCFGAPTFRVGAGEVVYLGDFVPFMNVELSTGDRASTVAYASHLEDARRTLAAQQPALAQALVPAALRNGATYACAAISMDRWDVAGAPMLEAPDTMDTANASAPVTSGGEPAASDVPAPSPAEGVSAEGDLPAAPAEGQPEAAESEPTPGSRE